MTNAATGAGNIQSYVAGVNLGWAYDTNLWQVNLSADTMGVQIMFGVVVRLCHLYTQALQVDPVYT